MLHDVVQRKKFYTLVLQKCLTRSHVNYNLIKDIRLRQILILNYIATDKLKDCDIFAIVGKSEPWYYPKKKQALKEFEKNI